MGDNKLMRASRLLLSGVVIAFFAAFGATQAVAQAWQVMSADYGVSNNRVDVTSTVRQLVNGPNFRANNSTMGIDPARGRDKVLRIHARNGAGQMRDFIYQEGQTVDARMFMGGGFPSNPGNYPGNGSRNLRILQASYGSGNRRRDVTNRLQSMVRHNRLNLLVNNDSMGGDPAFNQPKNLQVTYAFQGQQRNVNVNEWSNLTLP
jgi:Domain of unknown function (DUF3395)